MKKVLFHLSIFAAAFLVSLVLVAPFMRFGDETRRVETRPAPPAEAAAARRVLVISLDGLDARYLTRRDEFKLKIPNLRQLMTDGLAADGVVSVYPSITYPNHTAMVTGARPARHGIHGNSRFDTRQPNSNIGHWFAHEIKADTLWQAAERKGLTTALVSWPVSAGAGTWNVPEIWKPGGTLRETLAEVAKHARPGGFVDEVAAADPELFSHITDDEQDDMQTRFAEYLIEQKRPEVMFVHLRDLDHVEHELGPFTPEAFRMLEKLDAYVGRILDAARRAGTLDETALFIVSDHGFQTAAKRIHPGVILERAGLVKMHEERDGKRPPRVTITEWDALPYTTGGSAAIILRDPQDRDALRRAREAFESFARAEEGEGARFRFVEREEIARLGGNPAAAFMLEATEGYAFGWEFTGEPVTPSEQRGHHGYLPTRPGYHASFIAYGAGVRPRSAPLGTIDMTDVGPTIARTLGLTLRDAEGAALALR